MSSYVGSRIQIDTREGKYEGILSSIDPVTKLISLKQAIALPSGQKYLGLLNFYGQEINALTVIEENELPPAPLDGNQEPNIPPARSYEDPDNPEIFDDYQEGNQQVQSYSEEWGYDPAPAYSEEVTIMQETEQDRQDVHKDVCDGIKDMSLNNNTSSHPPQCNPAPKISSDTSSKIDPEEYIVINQHDDVFDQAIADIGQQSAIGLVLKGSKLGRKGKLSLVLVLCGEQIYMFDALALPSLFTRTFIDILQADDITKVMHDCRFASDLLYHHYGIQLSSVFDTQVGDILVKRRQYHGDFPRNVSGTTQCILEYLEIKIQDIAMHLEITQRIEEDESSWLQRPLSPANIRCALLDTKYLLHLREAITEQLMAEFTCAIDIYLSVERDRLEVDTKKLSSRAAYVPRELINGLRSRVDQMMIFSSRIKPEELSKLPSQSASPSQERRQSPSKGPSTRGTNGPEKLRLPPCGYQKTSPATSGRILEAKPRRHDPPRPPMMLDGTDKEYKEDDEDVLSVSSEDSEEAFGDTTEKELWQQRYSKNIQPVTLLEAMNAKQLEEEEEGDDHEGRIPKFQNDSFHEQQKWRTVERTTPPRTGPAEAAVSGPRRTIEAGRATDNPSSDDRVAFPKDSPDAVVSDHSYSQKLASFMPPKLTDLQQHNGNQSQNREMPAKLNNRQEYTQTRDMQDTMPVQASYVDVLLGKRNDEELKIKANRTLKAIGKALAAGDNFNKSMEQKETADNDDSEVNKHHGFDGYASYSKAYPGLSGQSNPRSEKKSADESPPRAIGRGRASLIDHQSYVLNPRQSQSRVAGGLGMRTAGELHSVQVDFPTAEEMESAPESVPIPAGSAFLSQRVIIPR